MSPVRTTPGTASRRLGVALLLAFVALVLAAPASVASAPAAAERTSAWVRAAHLSPGTGPVDVWLTPFGGVPGAATLTHVPYGAVSPYLPVAAGVYTVAMRPAGSPVSAPAVLTGVVRVQGGKAYSVLTSFRMVP